MALFGQKDALAIREFPFQIRQAIDSELEPDEVVRWADQPKPWRFARKTLPIVLFAIPWTAFAVFWICGAAGFKVPDFSKGWGLFPLFGLPFVLVGLGMFCSPLWMIRKAKRTVYIITNKRAIICEGGWGMSIKSFGPEQLTKIIRKQMPDDSGDLIFDYGIWIDPTGRMSRKPTGFSGINEIGFLGINNVRDVERMLKDLSA